MGAKQQAYKKLADTMIKNFSQRDVYKRQASSVSSMIVLSIPNS